MKGCFKKTITILLALALSFCVFSGSALADAPEFSSEHDTPISVMLLDADSGHVLYSRNADEKIYPASTTKIITALIILENVDDLDAEVTVGSEVNAFGDRDSLVTPRLVENEKCTYRDLMYGMLLCSGNDAAQALAVAVAGSIDEFVDMMYDKAAELGMEETSFVTVFGRDARVYEDEPERTEDPNLTTAEDMAKLMLEAVKNETLMEIVGTEKYTMAATNKTDERILYNTNRLISTGGPNNDSNEKYLYRYATGIKTGSTPKAYRCLAASATKDGMNLIALIYGDKTENGVDRWPLAKDLFEYGFDNFVTYNVAEKVAGIPLSVPVTGAADGENSSIRLTAAPLEEGAFITVPKGSEDGDEITPNLSVTSVPAPVIEGTEIGTVTYYSGDTVIGTAKVTAAESIAAKGSQLPLASAGVEEDEGHSPYVWLWLIVPAVIIIYLIVRTFVRQNRRHTRRRR